MARPVLVKSGIALIILGTVAGTMPMVIGMVTAFHQTADHPGAGTINDGELADSVENSLKWTMVMMPAVAFGLGLLFVGLVIGPKSRKVGQGPP